MEARPVECLCIEIPVERALTLGQDWIAHEIRPESRTRLFLCITHHVNRQAGASIEDSIHLPAAQQALTGSVPVAKEALTSPKGQFINCADHQVVGNVGIRYRPP